MSLRRLRILEPRWTCPAWAVGEGPFRVVLAGPTEAPIELRLRSREHTQPVRILSQERPSMPRRRQVVRLICQIEPGGLDLGRLCAVEVRSGIHETRAPNSLALLSDRPLAFTFAHISDLHLLAPKDGQLTDRRPLVERLVAEINRLSPAFVLNTGDLISRYGVEMARLDDRLIWWQAREARRLLLELAVPMLVIPGNHDRAFRASRSAWTRYMGRPWDRGTDDQTFAFGDARFVGLDGSQRCDESTDEKLDGRRTRAQLLWLRDELRAIASHRPRIVFTHWDYGGDIAPILNEEGCDLFLCGHTEAPPPGPFPYRLGHLPGSLALRLWHVQAGQATPGAAISFEALGTAPPFSAEALRTKQVPC